MRINQNTIDKYLRKTFIVEKGSFVPVSVAQEMLNSFCKMQGIQDGLIGMYMFIVFPDIRYTKMLVNDVNKTVFRDLKIQ